MPQRSPLVIYDDGSFGELPSTDTLPGLSGAATVVDYTTAGTFTETPPADATVVGIIVVGAGGGGGSGRRGPSTDVRFGGGGGGAGAYTYVEYPLSNLLALGATLSVIIGAPGTPGAAITVDATNGNTGGTGGNSSVSAGGTIVTFSQGGTGGGGGTTSAGTAGAAGATGEATGGAGGAGANATGSAGNGALIAPGGGAGGAGLAASATGSAGANGGRGARRQNGTTGSTGGGGSAGTIGGNGGNGSSSYLRPGEGGGSGGSTSTAAAGAGGNGIYGGGGGGGGASQNGFNSGPGGAGGAGFVRLIYWRSQALAQGVTAHSALSGLSADDHPQYYNQTRGDARYVQTAGFAEAVDDRVAQLLQAGTNISLAYNDAANTFTINSTGGGAATPLFDDPMVTLIQWSTSGTLETRESEAGRFGIQRFSTGSNVGDAAYLSLGFPSYGSFTIPLSGMFDVEMHVRLGQTGNATIYLGIGGNMFDGMPFGQSGAMFEKQPADANWQATVRTWNEGRNVNNTVDTGVAASTGWTSFRIRRTGANTIVFLINGAVVATADSSTPDGTFGSNRTLTAARQFGGRIATATSAAQSFDVDRMIVWAS